jgi:ATP-dependent protease ClpP protease subunit
MKEEDDDDDGDDDSYDQLMIWQTRNRVFFHVAITRRSIILLLQRLEEAQSYALINKCDHVLLFLHSEGGDAYAGLSGMNHIECARVPIHTIADGLVASAATFLLLAGSTRYSMRHSSVLIHQMSTGFWGKYADMIDEMQNTHQLMDAFRRIYTSKTKIRKKKLETILNKELTMTASQCLEFGITDAIYAPS